MGAEIEIEAAPEDGPEPVATLVVRSASALRPIELHGDRIAELIDELPLLSIAMAAADGTSTVRDAGELRVKESDRIALVVRNLRAIGVDVEELPDGWLVRGGVRARRRETPEIETRGDHRIAISFAVAALDRCRASGGHRRPGLCRGELSRLLGRPRDPCRAAERVAAA